MLKKEVKHVFRILIRNVLSCASMLVKVNKRRILFYSYSGEAYSCSPRYLCEYIRQNNSGRYEIIWAFRTPENVQDVPDDIIKVRYNSLKFLYYYASSRFIVNNIYPYIFLKTKRNQVMIDTWHGGGAYKCAVTDNNLRANQRYRKELDYYSRNISLFLSSSKAFTECFIRRDMHYRGEILNSGLIRNDLFFSDQKSISRIVEKVKRTLGLERAEKTLLYAPTWRLGDSKKNEVIFDVERLRNTLTERFGGSWRIVFRMHRLTTTELVTGTVDASGYPDMQELLLTADFLITDYSSCIWDFILTRRPILLYTYDLEKYTTKQGFYEDIHTWKLPVCESFDEVVRVIHETTNEQFIENANAHFNKLVGYDQGQAARNTAEYMLQRTE